MLVGIPGKPYQADSSDVEAHYDAWPDSNDDKCDALKKADDSESGGDCGEDDGDEKHVERTEGNPDPEAGAEDQLVLLTVERLAEEFHRLHQRLADAS